MEREVRYCTTEDGVRIAYCVEGEGPALLVCSNLVESFSVDYLNPWLESFYRELGKARTTVRYDPRGVGLSQRDAEDLTVDGLARDLEAVVDAADIPRVSLLALGAGAARAILYATQHADRLASLVVLDGLARTQDVMSEEALRALAELMRMNWRLGAQALTARVTTAEAEDGTVEMYRRSVTGEFVSTFILAGIGTDVTPLLSSVTTPALITHHIEHNVLPFALAQRMATAIQGAILVPLQSPSPEEYLAVAVPPIDSFLTKHGGATTISVATNRPGLRTVLFTDLVGHTEMMSRLGDKRGRQVLREHERIRRVYPPSARRKSAC